MFLFNYWYVILYSMMLNWPGPNFTMVYSLTFFLCQILCLNKTNVTETDLRHITDINVSNNYLKELFACNKLRGF
jgi:hypothetical protein